ncbi:hypothetical protein C8J57DRAFT_1706547 [Mycena rebaudengoi]|nr:hypothetical protein C8J57DRAFT_1706547 [Mycena rebaudengoi]
MASESADPAPKRKKIAVRSTPAQIKVLRASGTATGNRPDGTELERLSFETGLTTQWIRSWFMRERRRTRDELATNAVQGDDRSSDDVKAEFQDDVVPPPKRKRRGRPPRAVKAEAQPVDLPPPDDSFAPPPASTSARLPSPDDSFAPPPASTSTHPPLFSFLPLPPPPPPVGTFFPDPRTLPVPVPTRPPGQPDSSIDSHRSDSPYPPFYHIRPIPMLLHRPPHFHSEPLSTNTWGTAPSPRSMFTPAPLLIPTSGQNNNMLPAIEPPYQRFPPQHLPSHGPPAQYQLIPPASHNYHQRQAYHAIMDSPFAPPYHQHIPPPQAHHALESSHHATVTESSAYQHIPSQATTESQSASAPAAASSPLCSLDQNVSPRVQHSPFEPSFSSEPVQHTTSLMSSPNLRAYMPEPDDDAMSASSTGSSLLDTIDDQVLFSSMLNLTPVSPAVSRAAPSPDIFVSPRDPSVLDMDKAPLKHLAVLRAAFQAAGPGVARLTMDEMYERLLGDSLAQNDPFQAAMGLVFMSRTGLTWEC